MKFRPAILALIVILAVYGSLKTAAASGSTQNVSLVGPSTLYSGLVGWWTFDGKYIQKNIIDTSGQGNNGYFSGAGFVSTSSSLVQGKIGQALNIKGAYYVKVNSSSSLNPTAAVSVSAWFKQPYGGCTYICVLLNKGDGASLPGSQYEIVFDSSNNIRFEISNGSVWITAGGVAIAADNKWHHVVGTYDGSTVTIYIDGINKASTSGAAVIQTTSNALGIGSIGLSQNASLNAVVDDVRVYNRGLSATEASQIYGATAGGKKNVSLPGINNLASGMAAWYTFDGKDTRWAGATSTDMSGNGQDALILNMTNTGNVAQGKMGQAFFFKSSGSGHLQTPLTPVIGTGSYSYTVWFKVPSGVTQLAGLVSQRATAGFPQFTLSMSNAGISAAGNVISFIDNDGTLQRSGATAAAYNDGKWHHAALVRNSSTQTTLLYIDGSLSVTSNSTVMPNLTGTDNIMIGAAGDSGTNANFFFNGSLDDARIYNRALTATEVAALYNMSR